MKDVIISIIVVCGLSFCAPEAEATLITIEIEAVVDSVEDLGDGDGYLEGNIEVGDIITGSYIYDSSTLDSDPLDLIQGNYWHYALPAGISLTVGGFEFQTDPTDVQFRVAIRNDNLSGDDIYWIHSDKNLPLSNGTPVDYVSWGLKDHTGSVFSSDSLPITAPILNQWQENRLRIETSRAFYVHGHVTSAIPETATVLLFGLGGLLLRIRKRG